MKPAQLKIVQALADLAIPLLGYFFWNWSFYFILLFFVLDYLIFCVFSFVKVQKINSFQGLKDRFAIEKALYTVLLVAMSIAAIIPALSLIEPNFNLARDTWAFLAYKDIGIEQGYVLLPLLVYGGYAQYKMQFLMPGKFAVATVAEIWKIHFRTVYLVLAFSGLLLGISWLVVFPSVIYTMTLVFGVATYRFFYSR